MSELTELYRCFPGGFVENGQRDNVLFFTPDQLVDTVPALIDIDIAAVGFIPLADLKDNDFLVYRPMKRQYSVYNIVDETEYGETGKLEKILRDLLTFD